jgi:2-(1,2-epoxy-1,2-dihydrophenyl)acetyl-CoA isomerase
MIQQGQLEATPAGESVVNIDFNPGTGVAVITFSRGQHNYLSYDFVDEVATALERAEELGCRAIVLRTTSRHFCAGADFGMQRQRGDGAPHIFDIVPRLFRLTVPVVAEIRGAAVGAGLGLALAADFRVTTPSAFFLANFTRLGISPGFGLTLTLPRLIGDQRAAEMFYTARRFTGEEGVDIGLCDRIAAPEGLEHEALAFAEEIALSSPRAIASTRRTFRSELAARIEETLQYELSEQTPLMATDDFREGVKAWRERRAPNFRGT